MKLNIVLVLAAAASTIGATNLNTNARRMARGLPPLPPIRRATPADVARKTHPSGSYHGCNTGSSLHCCNSVKSADSDTAGLLKLFGILAPVDTPIGIGCSPISLLGKRTCNQQVACCEKNQYNAPISIGCSPVNLF